MEYMENSKVRLLINLYFCRNDSPKRVSSISKIIASAGYPATDFTKRNIIKELIAQNIMVQNGITETGFNTYYINKKLLQKFIDQQAIVQLVSRYKKETAILFD